MPPSIQVGRMSTSNDMISSSVSKISKISMKSIKVFCTKLSKSRVIQLFHSFDSLAICTNKSLYHNIIEKFRVMSYNDKF